MKKLLVILLVCLTLCACGDNQFEKVDEQLQGKWVYLLMSDTGIAYEFVDGKASAMIYLNDEYTVANTGKYEIKDEVIEITYDYIVKIDENGNTTKEENTSGPNLSLKYTFENDVLKVFYESGSLRGEMVKK